MTFPRSTFSVTKRQKPRVGSRIDWGHPLAQGLVGCWLFNEGGGSRAYNIAGIVNYCSFFGGPVCSGNFVAFDGSDDYLESNINFPNYSAISIILRVRPHETSDGGWCAIGTHDYPSDVFTGIRLDFPMRATCDFADPSGAGAHRINSNDNSITIDVFQDVAFTAEDVTDLKVYINGIQNTNDSVSQEGGYLTNQGTMNIGAGIKGYSYSDIEYLYYFNKVLSTSEIFQLHAEPYCFIQNPRYWYMVDFGAAAGGTGRISLYGDLNGPGGMGQQHWNPLE